MEEEDFKTRLKSAKNRAKSKYSESKEPSTSGMGHAFKMSTELVAAVAVGTIIGFILDNWFGTKPWLILIFFFVGVIDTPYFYFTIFTSSLMVSGDYDSIRGHS